jgi:hypothetical protein
MVIGYQPRPDSNFHHYSEAAAIVLTIKFLNIEYWFEPLGPFDPEKPLEVSENLHLMDPTSYVNIHDASQSVCGYLFMEMWSNDKDGFPMPMGCFYGPVQQDYEYDMIAQKNYEPKYREISIMFDPKTAPLRSYCTATTYLADGTTSVTNAGCEYQFVLNARVNHIPLTDPVVEPMQVYVKCLSTFDLEPNRVDLSGNIPMTGFAGLSS